MHARTHVSTTRTHARTCNIRKRDKTMLKKQIKIVKNIILIDVRFNIYPNNIYWRYID